MIQRSPGSVPPDLGGLGPCNLSGVSFFTFRALLLQNSRPHFCTVQLEQKSVARRAVTPGVCMLSCALCLGLQDMAGCLWPVKWVSLTLSPAARRKFD